MTVILRPHPQRQDQIAPVDCNNGAWHDLRQYLNVVAPEMLDRICVPWREPTGFFDDTQEIPDDYEPENDDARLLGWQNNDGLGLKAEDCGVLAATITTDLETGRTPLRFKDDDEGRWMVRFITEFRDFLQKCGGFRIF